MDSIWLEREYILTERLDSEFYSSQFVDCDHRVTREGKHSLARCCSRIVDHSFLAVRTEDYVSEGVPFIRVRDLGDLLLDSTDLIYITPEAHQAEANTIFRPGNILVAKTGKLAASVIPTHIVECNTSQDVMGAVVSDDCDPYYLTAFLGSRSGLLQQERWQSGQVQRHLTLGNLRKLNVFLPSSNVQRAIGNLVRKAERLRYFAIGARNLAQRRLMKVLHGEPDTNAAEEFRNKGWFVEDDDFESRLDAEYYLPEYVELLHHLESACTTEPLSELEVNGAYGTLPSSNEYGTGNARLIRGKDLTGQALMDVPDSAPFVPDSYLERGKARIGPNEVMLLIKGATIAEPQSVGIVSDKWDTPSIVNGSIYKFAVREDTDPYYVCAFMGSVFGLKQKLRAIANTGIFYNDQDAIRSFRIAIPDEDSQRSIGNALRSASSQTVEYLSLISEAKSTVEAAIVGAFTDREIDEQFESIDEWLKSNPIPDENGK